MIARAGDTLEIQHKLLCNLRNRPDLLVIYCGHNEFYSRLWWARNLDHYVSERRPRRWRVFLERVERLSPVCTLIGESAEKCRIAIPPPSDTARSLVDVPNYTASVHDDPVGFPPSSRGNDGVCRAGRRLAGVDPAAS